jgi:2',3'-cyclic-nucleotide 2'-phosphodiesterase (5'-nucleotidase family)
MFDAHTSWTRREFLKLAGKAGLVGAVPTLASAAATLNPDTVCISILHTTDLHGHILPTSDYDGNPDRGGLARCARQIRRWQEENPNSILIDIGDVYQGTDVSLRNKGALMVDLLNHLEYDTWVVGNHEFDWGMECFERAVQQSNMPVLAANMLMEGKLAGEFPDAKHPFAKIKPFILKELAGIKIAIIGVTTPGMRFWLWPDFTKGLDFRHPVEPVRRAIARAKSEGAHAIVLTGHMGLKERTGGDDFANTVMALTSEFPEVAVFIAGHTHQDIPSRLTNGVLFTQADHFGIHAGRVDLFFDRNSKKLMRREAICELMDNRLGFDPIILSRAKSQLAESEAALSEPIGELAETLRGRSHPGRPSDVERLIGAAISEMLIERSVPVDGVMHGTFDDKADLVAGTKTVNEVWNVIPYENYIVTAQLSPEQIRVAMEDAFASHEKRNLLGFEVKTEGHGDDCKIVSMTLANREPLDRSKKYVVAFNSFDARSGGHHFMKLRALLERPEANCVLHPIQTRDALIGYFQRHKIVRRIAAVNPLSIAA